MIDAPKICHLTSVHVPDDIRIFIKECSTAAAAGYDTALIAPDAPEGVRNGVKLIAVRGWHDHRARRLTQTTWHVYRRAREIDADLYHFHDAELIFIGLLLRARGKHVVYDIHEDVPGSLATRDYLPRAVRPALQWLVGRIENMAARHFSALVPATPSISARFERYNPKTIVINNYPLIDELVAPTQHPWSARANAVAYVGGISPERGIYEILDALEELDGDSGVALELAGRYSPPRYRDRLRSHPGWRHVNERGLIGRVDLARLLGNVRVGLLLFHPAPNHVEAQPNKFFEYMAAGLPLIASDFPLWRKFIEEAQCGLVVNPHDPKAIARAVQFLLHHPDEAEAMGRRGRELVERRFNWEAERYKLVQLYTDLVGDVPVSPATPGVKEETTLCAE